MKAYRITENPLHEGKIFWVSIIAWGLVIAGAVAAIPGISKYFNGSSFTLTELSGLGSYLQGAVQSLWTLASFLFIYVAFLGQKQQTRLQAEQFALEQAQQKVDLDNQAKQFQLQQDSIKLQSFEASFFQLLQLHNQLVSEMEAGSAQVRHGRDCFVRYQGALNAKFAKLYSDRLMPPLNWTLEQERTAIIKYYLVVYKENQSKLGHYFRTLYHIIKFVKDSEYDYKTQRRYTSLVRAQLSAPELTILFYNGICPHGEKFKPLIEEFGLLEHLDKASLVIGGPNHEDFYEQQAYH